jgi:hypothetical protein
VQERPRSQAAPEDALIDSLRLAPRVVAPTPAARRNPFVFATRDAGAGPSRRVAQQPLTTAEPLSPVALRAPAYVLSGIGINGTVRTAVLTTTGADVHIVSVNDSVGGYKVVDISDTTVTLERDGERHMLRFQP